jgi:uncharacterized protein
LKRRVELALAHLKQYFAYRYETGDALLMRSLKMLLSLIFGLTPFASGAQPRQPFADGHPALLTFATSVSSQDFQSAINGRDYRLFVSIPDGPAPEDGFPVIYLLDGNGTFGIASDSQGMRQMIKELPPAIVVGIGYPTYSAREILSLRVKDLTLPVPTDNPPPGLEEPADSYGGVDTFLRVIELEIKPRIAKMAMVNAANQTLFGHSYGGLAVLRALFTEPTSFQTYIAASPSIQFNRQAVLADEVRFSQKVTAGSVQPRILLEAGGLERNGSSILDNAIALGKRLEDLKGGPGYEAKTVSFPDETHVSVLPGAISRALTFAFGPKR